MQRSLFGFWFACILSTSVGAETSNTEVSGLIEIEAALTETPIADTSDITLATVELGVAHQLTERLEAGILFLYEEGENNNRVAVDEAGIALQLYPNVTLDIGRMYVPFGVFDTLMVSDPLTLEIAETQEEAIQFNVDSNRGYGGSIYLYKDDEDGSNSIDDYGINLVYESESFTASASYITDVNDKSNASKAVSGVGIHSTMKINKTLLLAEHIALSSNASGEQSKATSLELGYDLGKDRVVALSFQQTKEAMSLGLAEDVIGLAYTMSVFLQGSLSAEYLKKDHYDGSDERVTTLQLAYEF